MDNNQLLPIIQVLKKQKYHIVGKHSAVKRCKWFYEALTTGRHCYKQKFYGIKSHKCIQMSPTLFNCTQQCLFCWRAQNRDLKNIWDENRLPDWEQPDLIFKGIIEAQNKILGGYKGNPRTISQNFREALTPKHVAISLTGEPTLYEYLGEFIEYLSTNKLTSFLVSNGTMPEKIVNLNKEPTQMYISVCAPDKETFKRVCRPQQPNAWSKLKDTLEILQSFKCPTVIRTTLVKGENMNNIEGYAKLIKKANPTYIEAKAYMHVGFSCLRLGHKNMPIHKDIYEFAEKLSEKTGYKILDESIESRVVLLSKRNKPLRFE